MKKHNLILIATLTLVTEAAVAVPFTETGDAGSLVGTAQSVGAGVISISGAIGRTDQEDLYSFFWGGDCSRQPPTGNTAHPRHSIPSFSCSMAVACLSNPMMTPSIALAA